MRPVLLEMPGSLADFSQESILEAVFDQRLAFFLGCKPAPTAGASRTICGAGAERVPGRGRAPPQSPCTPKTQCLPRRELADKSPLAAGTHLYFHHLQSVYIQLSRISRLSIQNAHTLGLSIQEHFTTHHLISRQYILSPTLLV